MPKSAENQDASGAEEPFPDTESGQNPQPVARPQVAPAQAKAGLEPAGSEQTANGQLRKPGEAAVQRAQGIGAGAQQETGQDASQNPVENQVRVHRSRPRFRPGWG